VTQTRAWSWRHAIIKSSLPATTRHVLLTISCFMNELGDGCYPTQEQIAEATGLSIRAVREHVDTAVEAGWLTRQEHGFKGQKWRNYEYAAAWPETQHVDKGAEPGAGPSDEGAARGSEGAEPGAGKVRHHVPPTSPSLSNTSPPSALTRADGGEFNILWEAWPAQHRPDNRSAAQALFEKLSADERRQAVHYASAHHRRQILRKERPLMVPYLKRRLFEELHGAPPIDEAGDFVITPERPEWGEWLGDIRRRYGEPGVRSILKCKQVRQPRRWPEKQVEAAE
jgi:hypothetical protein